MKAVVREQHFRSLLSGNRAVLSNGVFSVDLQSFSTESRPAGAVLPGQRLENGARALCGYSASRAFSIPVEADSRLSTACHAGFTFMIHSSASLFV